LQAKSYMEKGKLVPDEITIKMVLERIAAADCQVGIILDGFPRNVEQAKALDEALKLQKKNIDKTVYIKVSESELLKRLTGRWICRKCQAPYHEVSSPPKIQGKCDKCGGELYQRADDNTETIKKRLEVFFAETAPLIEYYNRVNKLLEVQGEGSMEEICDRIISALQSKSSKK
jgi:adenylate kinase